MKTFTAGDFEIDVSNGTPVKITVKKFDEDGVMNGYFHMRPQDIVDLQHVLKRAKSQCVLELGGTYTVKDSLK
jgi:hypothetical protein